MYFQNTLRSPRSLLIRAFSRQKPLILLAFAYSN